MKSFILRPIPQPLHEQLSTTRLSPSLNRLGQPPLAPCLNIRMSSANPDGALLISWVARELLCTAVLTAPQQTFLQAR